MAKKQEIAARHYDVIVAPHITEKGDDGWVRTTPWCSRSPMMRPSRRSRKPWKHCTTSRSLSVNTVVVKGKTKRWKGKPLQAV